MNFFRRHFLFQLIGLGILFLFLAWVIFNTQHTVWVEMLTYPYLLNHGFVLYKDLIAPYTPLLLWFLQGVESWTGYTPQFSQWATLILGLGNIFLIWLVSQKLWKNSLIALLSAAFYTLWFQYFEGNGLWFEIFQTPFLILAFYFLYQYFFGTSSKRNLVLGGIFLALSFFIKQSVIWIFLMVFVWGIIEIWIVKQAQRKILSFAAALIMPLVLLLGLTSLVAYFGGYLREYWWWVYYYTFLIFPLSPGHSDYPKFLQLIKLGIPLLVLLPLVFAVFKRKKEALFCLLFLAASAMAVLPRWSLFHLQPFLAISSILVFPFWKNWFTKTAWKYLTVILIAGLWAFVAGRQIERFWGLEYRFFDTGTYKISREVELAGYRDLYNFNGPDQIYVLSGITPRVKPYVQNFAWYMELPGMQEKVIDSLSTEDIRHIIYSPFTGKGGYNIGDYRPKLLADYIDQNYNLKEKLAEDIWVLERKKD